MRRTVRRTLVVTLVPLLLLAPALALWPAAPASARILVYPREVVPDYPEKFTIYVSGEKNVPVTKVEVDIPEDIQIYRFEPLPPWTYEAKRGKDGRITSITWSGGRIEPDQFVEFEVRGQTPKREGKVFWAGREYFADGTMLSFDRLEGKEQDASPMWVKAKPKPPAEPPPASPAPPPSQSAPAAPSAFDRATQVAAWAALLLSAANLVLTLRRR